MSDMLPAATSVLALHVGRARERWEGKPPSAIAKEPVPEALDLGYEGFSADEQADRKVHGGPEKAVHHYPAAHYAWWRERFPDHEDVLRSGGFGENIVADGLDEESVCLGDRFRLGRALVEICQGRQPCWKLAAHTGIAAMAGAMQKSGRTGWYSPGCHATASGLKRRTSRGWSPMTQSAALTLFHFFASAPRTPTRQHAPRSAARVSAGRASPYLAGGSARSPLASSLSKLR